MSQHPEDPRRPLPPPAVPPQWQQDAPPRQDPPRGERGYQPTQAAPQYEPTFQPSPPPRPQWQPPTYQQPHHWPPQQPYYAPPRPKSWPSRHKALTAVLAAFGLVVIIGIAAAAGSGSGSGSTAPSAGSVPTGPAAPAAPTTHPAKAVKAVTVATFSGNGIQTTAPFSTTGTWKLAYSFDCSSFGYKGNFQVYEYSDSDLSSVLTNDLAMTKTSTSWAYNDAGTHHLEVNSECSWKLKVIDEGS